MAVIWCGITEQPRSGRKVRDARREMAWSCVASLR